MSVTKVQQKNWQVRQIRTAIFEKRNKNRPLADFNKTGTCLGCAQKRFDWSAILCLSTTLLRWMIECKRFHSTEIKKHTETVCILVSKNGAGFGGKWILNHRQIFLNCVYWWNGWWGAECVAEICYHWKFHNDPRLLARDVTVWFSEFSCKFCEQLPFDQCPQYRH